MSSRDDVTIGELEEALQAGSDSAFESAFDGLMRQARAGAGPAPALRLQLREQVWTRLGIEPLPTLPRHAASAPARLLPLAALPRRSPWLSFGTGVGLVALGVAIGFVWGRVPTRSSASLDAATLHIVDAPARHAVGPSVVSAAPPPTLAPVPAPIAEADESVAPTLPAVAAARARPIPRSAHSPAPSESAAAAGVSGNPLRDALETLRRAHEALRAEEPAMALVDLDALEKRVPSSVLEEERAVTRALALCAHGEPKRARQVAARVLADNPSSVYAMSLGDSCAGHEELLNQMRGRVSKPAP